MNSFLVGFVASLAAGLAVFFIGYIFRAIGSSGHFFVSIPMEALEGEAEYNEVKSVAKDLVSELRSQNKKVYCGVDELQGDQKFEQPTTKAPQVFEKIRKSKYFILVLPKRLGSGSLVELGYAASKRKRMIVFYAKAAQGEKDTLPWIARGIPKITRVAFNSLDDVMDNFKGDNLKSLLKNT